VSLPEVEPLHVPLEAVQETITPLESLTLPLPVTVTVSV
jgi:hypothetical protein